MQNLVLVWSNQSSFCNLVSLFHFTTLYVNYSGLVDVGVVSNVCVLTMLKQYGSASIVQYLEHVCRACKILNRKTDQV